uniref:Uncharacterized protein n=1 Tax=Oryza brachyantha TaxID=4533 RepID=J3LEQ8_ORYBR
MGKSRGERRVIFSSSGATHTTSASHLRRLLGRTAAPRARETPPPETEAPRAPGGAAAGAERHHRDAMVEAEAAAAALLPGWRSRVGIGVFRAG